MSLVVGYKQSGKAFKAFEYELKAKKEGRKRKMIEELYSTDEEVVNKWLSLKHPAYHKDEKAGANWYRAVSALLVTFAVCYFPFYHMVRFLFLRDGKRTAKWGILGVVFSLLPALFMALIFAPIDSLGFLVFISVLLFFFMIAGFRAIGHVLAHREEITLAFVLILLLNSREQYVNKFDAFYGKYMIKMNPELSNQMRNEM
ncbi:hypothetical protein JSY36_04720 [Bacillus sp. H-16]|uniref:hypothetical protein n=1 Tax=Alteribacter salitolerans TaxID=2912333 RepID=UPI00196278BF|nr:hypothetical protein [Alteribacter salitolerans]MBM7095055.1 hypothetical protein [Alteribacter salitolerans]